MVVCGCAVVCGCRVAGSAVLNAGTLQLQSALTTALRHILSGQALTAAQQAQLAAAASTAAASGATAAGAGEKEQQQQHCVVLPFSKAAFVLVVKRARRTVCVPICAYNPGSPMTANSTPGILLSAQCLLQKPCCVFPLPTLMHTMLCAKLCCIHVPHVHPTHFPCRCCGHLPPHAIVLAAQGLLLTRTHAYHPAVC